MWPACECGLAPREPGGARGYRHDQRASRRSSCPNSRRHPRGSDRSGPCTESPVVPEPHRRPARARRGYGTVPSRRLVARRPDPGGHPPVPRSARLGPLRRAPAGTRPCSRSPAAIEPSSSSGSRSSASSALTNGGIVDAPYGSGSRSAPRQHRAGVLRPARVADDDEAELSPPQAVRRRRRRRRRVPLTVPPSRPLSPSAPSGRSASWGPNLLREVDADTSIAVGPEGQPVVDVGHADAARRPPAVIPRDVHAGDIRTGVAILTSPNVATKSSSVSATPSRDGRRSMSNSTGD